MLVDISVILALISLNGLFAMSELAIVSSRRSRLENLARAGSAGARKALALIDEPTAFLSTVQVGITLVGICAGAFSGVALGEDLGRWLAQWPAIAPHADRIAVGALVLLITYATLVVGELVPKRIALRRPERIAVLVSPGMQRLVRAAAPVVWALKTSTEGLLRLLGSAGGAEPRVTEDEVRMLIAEGTRTGVFHKREREMIDGVLRLADRRVRAIMTPRQEILWLDENAAREEIAERLESCNVSRFPVCRATIDDPVGVVEIKELAPALFRGDAVRLPEHMVAPLVVPEGLHVLQLIDRFRAEGVHMAIVVDEYGSTEGIVTPADVLEAIAGELPEHGEEPARGLVRRRDGSWLVDGAFPIDEFEDRVKVSGLQETERFDTVAGFVLHRMERLPSVGDGFLTSVGRFEILDMDGHRIDKILYVPPEPETAATTKDA